MKAARSRLFRGGRPAITEINESHLGWLWANFKLENPHADDSPEANRRFDELALQTLSAHSEVYFIEDKCRQSARDRIPVGMIYANRDEWTLRPHAYWFQWAEKRHKVRGTVAYLLRRVRSKDLGGQVGLCEINADEENAEFFKSISRYITVKRGGVVSNARPDGAGHFFYVRGTQAGRKHDLHR